MGQVTCGNCQTQHEGRFCYRCGTPSPAGPAPSGGPQPGDDKLTADQLRELAELYNASQESPMQLACHLVAQSPQPLVFYAWMALALVKAKVLTVDDLASLGIDAQELGQLVTVLTNAEDADAAASELAVAGAMRKYELALDEILIERGVTLTEEKRKVVRTRIASFAYQHDIIDFKIAYRLLKAEHGDPLADLEPKAGGGYL